MSGGRRTDSAAGRGSGSGTRLKIAASALIALPAAALLVLAIGEMAGGDLTAAQHIPEAAALLLLLAAGWRYPRVTGVLLVVGGAIVAALWLALVATRGDLSLSGLDLLGWLVVGLLLFATPVVAGLLLLAAARREGESGD